MNYLILIILLTACGETKNDSNDQAKSEETTTDIVKESPDTTNVVEDVCASPVKDEVEDTILELQANEWLDPATGDLWLVGNSGNHVAAISACTGAYRLPTVSELMGAANRGLFLVATSLGSTNKGWTSADHFPNDTTYASYINVSSGLVISSPLLKTSSSGIFCIQ